MAMEGMEGMDQEVKTYWKNLRCADIEELVDEYIDAEMNDGEKWRFEAHISRCEKCRELVSDFQNLVDAARTLAEKPIDPGVQRRLREALQREVGFESSELRAPLRLIKG